MTEICATILFCKNKSALLNLQTVFICKWVIDTHFSLQLLAQLVPLAQCELLCSLDVRRRASSTIASNDISS